MNNMVKMCMICNNVPLHTICRIYEIRCKMIRKIGRIVCPNSPIRSLEQNHCLFRVFRPICKMCKTICKICTECCYSILCIFCILFCTFCANQYAKYAQCAKQYAKYAQYSNMHNMHSPLCWCAQAGACHSLEPDGLPASRAPGPRVAARAHWQWGCHVLWWTSNTLTTQNLFATAAASPSRFCFSAGRIASTGSNLKFQLEVQTWT